jgi:hypothetical protein
MRCASCARWTLTCGVYGWCDVGRGPELRSGLDTVCEHFVSLKPACEPHSEQRDPSADDEPDPTP